VKVTESAAQRRCALFYAESAAGIYDASIDLVVPQYRTLHETTFRLLHDHVQASWSDPAAFDGWVLDIGSGTGEEAVRLLTAFPQARVVAVDLCAPMHDVLRKKARAATCLDRCTTVLGDIVGKECAPAALRKVLPLPDRKDGYHAAISAFALHHLEHGEKRRAYQRVYDVLRPGGLLLNADLFSFQSKDLSTRALAFELSYIEEYLGGENVESLLSRRVRRKLTTGWLEHYRVYNRLEPIEDAPSGKRPPGQARMLLDAGFREVAVPYRYWQTGILMAIK